MVRDNYRFLNAVSSRLESRGFLYSEQSRHALYIHRWHRPVSWSGEFHDFIGLHVVSRASGDVSIGADIGIASVALSRIERDAKLWSCRAGESPPNEGGDDRPTPLFSVPLHWLALNAGDSTTRWIVASESGHTDESQFMTSVDRHALPFFESIRKPNDLADLVLHFDDYPKRVKPFGFVASDVVGYLAAAQYVAGDAPAATKTIDRALEGSIPKSVMRDFEYDPEYQPVFECRLRRLRKYILSATD